MSVRLTDMQTEWLMADLSSSSIAFLADDIMRCLQASALKLWKPFLDHKGAVQVHLTRVMFEFWDCSDCRNCMQCLQLHI